MRQRITIAISLLLLSSSFSITAQTGPTDRLRDDYLRRRLQPARTALPEDGELDLEALSVNPMATPVPVTIDATRSIRTVDARFPAINAAIWDSSFETRTTITLLQAMGTTLVRFPGGSASDEYHWRTNMSQGQTFQWATSFDDFAGIAAAVGSQAMITVNYGTGTADEAAGWVEYSNVTKGYGFKYWEIGNENYGSWETDSHGVKQDPFTYANEAKDYITRMKAVDPTIKIGVVVTTGEDSYTNNRSHPATNPRTGVVHNGWTPVVLATLKSLNTIPDYVIYHRYEQNPGQESDARLLQSASTWKNDATDLRRQLTDYLGSDAAGVEILCTENNSVSSNPGKQMTSLVNGLFLADTTGNILQTEFNTLVWWDFGNGYTTGANNSESLYGWRPYGDYGITSTDDDPYPTYYVFKLLSHFALPGDTVIDARSQSSLLGAYAARRSDGRLSVLLINKSPTDDITAQIALNGFTPSSQAVVLSYGKTQDDASRTLNGSPDLAQSIFQGASTNFNYTVPPYSVTLMSIVPSNDFELAVTPSSQTISRSGQANFNLLAAFGSGFSDSLSLAAAVDGSAGVNVSLPQPMITPTQNGSLIVTPQAGASPQSYSVNITAIGGGIQRSARVEVTVVDPPVISSATMEGKLLTITVSNIGNPQLLLNPRVLINGVDQTDKIKRFEGSNIVIKGKKGILGIVPGTDNRLRVVRGPAASEEFILRL